MNNQIGKKHYKISETAEIIGVPQSTLRYWETEFPDLKPRRSAHNQRFYSPADIEYLRIIHFLLHTKGLKVEAAKEYLKHNRKNISNRINVLDKLQEVKNDLEILLEALNVRAQKMGILQ